MVSFLSKLYRIKCFGLVHSSSSIQSLVALVASESRWLGHPQIFLDIKLIISLICLHVLDVEKDLRFVSRLLRMYVDDLLFNIAIHLINVDN